MASNKNRDITIEIQTKTNKALKDIKVLNRELNKLKDANKNFVSTNKDIKNMSRSFGSLATHLGKIAVIYTSFSGLSSTIKTFTNFEESLSRLKAISGANNIEMKKFEEISRELGATTQYTASQVAGGLNSMAMAGFSLKESIDSIAPSLDLATVSMLSISDASLISIRTMNGFGLKSKDMGRITDVIVSGATNSAQSVAELGAAFEKVGSVANSYNYSLETTTASLAILADAGRVGSEAGTQLKIVMDRLASNKEAKKYMKELGISMYNAKQELIPFKEQLIILKDTFSNLSEEKRNLKLGQIVGTEGKASLINLLNNLDKYDEKLSIISNSYGVASEKSKVMRDNLAGTWKELESAVSELAITMGETLIPFIRGATKEAINFIRGLSKEEISLFTKQLIELANFGKDVTLMFGSMLGSISLLSSSINDATGMSGAYVLAIGLIIYKIGGLTASITSVKLALSGLNPALAAIASGTIAITYAFDQWEQQLKRLDSAVNSTNSSLKGFIKIQEDAFTDKTVSEKTIVNDLASIDIAIENSGASLKKYKQEREDIKNQVWISSYDENSLRVLNTAIDAGTKLLKAQKDTKVALIAKGKELRVQIIKEEEAIKKEAIAVAKSNELKDEEIKNIGKQVKGYEKREIVLTSSLHKMLQKETNYKSEIEKLEQSKLGIYKKYADARLGLKTSLDNKIFDLKNSGLSNLEVYNNSQIRAEKQLSLAKESILQKDFLSAERYLNEYDSLISVSAAQEISHKERVLQKSKETGRYEYESIKVVDIARSESLSKAIREEQDGNAVRLQLINGRENGEINAINAKIESRRVDLRLQKAQITLQKEMIVILNEVINKGRNVKVDIDFTAFNEAIKLADTEINNLENKKTKVNLKAVVDKKEINNLQSDVSRNKVVQKVDVKVGGSGFTKFNIIRNGVSKSVLTQKVLVNVNDSKFKIFKVSAKTPVQSSINVNTNDAINSVSKVRAYAQKAMYSTLYVKTIQTRSSGGVIPKYNMGGLEDGIGHTRQQGELGGYGGGDKIKALLEAGEFIVRKEAVKNLGLARMYEINRGNIPKFKDGGYLGNSVSTKSIESSGSTVDLNFNIGGKTFKAKSTESTANNLSEYLRSAEL